MSYRDGHLQISEAGVKDHRDFIEQPGVFVLAIKVIKSEPAAKNAFGTHAA